MNAVNAVQLFLLVWSFSTVCHGDTGVCSVSCDDVTGTVGNEVTLTCRVSEKCKEDCIKMFKFLYPENYKNSEICRQKSPGGSCEKENIFTCRYTPDAAINETIRFFMQTRSSPVKGKFTVEISAGLMKSTADTEALINEEAHKYMGTSETRKEEKQDRGFQLAVILAVVSCFIIIIIVVIFKVKKSESTRPRLGQKENSDTLLHNV
ncbi:uncharacterized protein LOC562542 isoform 2 precursor [Danio rerio]|uniref:Uncharacterized LOC562542 n=1 Tax=Danio rerio TaxID=7955 RepID=A0A2R8PYQ3_DANRE|nr:uncharacterized protein LOC562542 isoform 2 precursor [Danio rerio]|eukprot:NP_001314806.1 uncharacterized protein LOC562542 isoform 2 precursor [Danio rerio]